MRYLCDSCGLDFELNDGEKKSCPDCDGGDIYPQIFDRDPKENYWSMDEEDRIN